MVCHLKTPQRYLLNALGHRCNGCAAIGLQVHCMSYVRHAYCNIHIKRLPELRDIYYSHAARNATVSKDERTTSSKRVDKLRGLPTAQ